MLTCVSVLWAFLLPPVAVALRGAPCSVIMLNALLTFFLWAPGVIHALCVIGLIGEMERDREMDRWRNGEKREKTEKREKRHREREREKKNWQRKKTTPSQTHLFL